MELLLHIFQGLTTKLIHSRCLDFVSNLYLYVRSTLPTAENKACHAHEHSVFNDRVGTGRAVPCLFCYVHLMRGSDFLTGEQNVSISASAASGDLSPLFFMASFDSINSCP